MRRRRIHIGGGLAVLLTLGLIAPGAAPAATKPTVTTGAAANVGQQTAALTGRVNPNGSETTYFFQYGTTSLYGSATPQAGAGHGTKAVNVAAEIGGLAPATTYHYRLVAQNAQGLTRGGDRTFRTQRQPLGLTLAANPNPVFPGAPTLIAGTLSGTGNANRQVVLQSNPFPYTQGFQNASDVHLTNQDGSFSFPVLSVPLNTQYRVILPNVQSVQSPIVTVGVRPLVTAHAKRVRRTAHGAIVRFSGHIRPAHDGASIAIQRLRKGAWVTIAGTVARHSHGGVSRYRKRVRLRRGGTFRIFAGTNDGASLETTSRDLHVRVH